MARKDLDMVAGVMREVLDIFSVQNSALAQKVVSMIACRIADICAEEDDWFNEDRFRGLMVLQW